MMIIVTSLWGAAWNLIMSRSMNSLARDWKTHNNCEQGCFDFSQLILKNVFFTQGLKLPWTDSIWALSLWNVKHAIPNVVCFIMAYVLSPLVHDCTNFWYTYCASLGEVLRAVCIGLMWLRIRTWRLLWTRQRSFAFRKMPNISRLAGEFSFWRRTVLRAIN